MRGGRHVGLPAMGCRPAITSAYATKETRIMSTPRHLPLVLSLLSLGAIFFDAVPAHAADGVVLQTTFDGPDSLRGWTGATEKGVGLVPGYRGSQSLLVERPISDGPGYRGVRKTLPLDELRGTRIKVQAMIKADGVARPPNPWNGVKCMVHTVAPAGQAWIQQDNLHGAFDWKPVGFTADVPADATAAELSLGLELTTGRAWFDDVKITVIGKRRSRPAKPAADGQVGGPVLRKPYTGHDLPRLRGAMISPGVTEADLRVLGGQWKANHVRWQLLWGGFPHSPADNGDMAAYDAWLESALKHLDSLLPVCEAVGIKVLVDLHTPPGGRNDASECRIFKEKRFQEAFLNVWEKVARRYRGNKTVWGYDLVNEPLEGVVEEGLLDWHELATRTAKLVRQIDAEHAIIVEPAPWGSPDGLDWFEPLPVPGVVYSVHMYLPHRFTHQGVYGGPTGIAYPGTIEGKHWGREQLRQALRPAIEYQRDYGVQIYLGEFSAIRWAPGRSACNYLRDLISICEENGWDWAYHAFREWDGWSVEHGPDPNDHARSKTPTERETLLREWYGKNQKAP
jgi:endoglucanase